MWLLIPGVLLFGYSALIAWYRMSWVGLPATVTNPLFGLEASTTVTVIVPARNEENNIGNCIQSILHQSYPAHLLEIIVIDDASTDNTASIVHAFTKKNPLLRLITLQPTEAGKSHKKRAVEKAIQLAAGTLIVCTDADCIHPKKWIETIAFSYEKNGNVFIAAPVMYHTQKTVCSIFQTLDFLSLQGITGASVHKRFHTMCNGANIGYSRPAFFEVNGFEGIDALPTGDDMLLMHKIYKKHPTKIIWIKSKDALVLTDAAPNWKAFFNQRIRWASKAAFFDDKRIFYVLLLVYLLNVSLLLTGILSFFSLYAFKALLILLAVKTIIELWFMIPVAKFFNKQKWLWYFPLMQPLHIIYTVIAGWLGRFGKYEWKGRVVVKAVG
jgi:cellulose synthase/poly-beta-1,6-N-acetylglucosamine synthase-like glycosyltransferase